jgi:hypothetical protein
MRKLAGNLKNNWKKIMKFSFCFWQRRNRSKWLKVWGDDLQVKLLMKRRCETFVMFVIAC